MALDTITLNATTDANGFARVRFRPSSRQNWTIRQYSVKAFAAIGTSALVAVKLNGTFVCPIIPAQQGAATEPPPVPVPNGSYSDVEWSQCNTGVNVECMIIYDDGTGP